MSLVALLRSGLEATRTLASAIPPSQKIPFIAVLGNEGGDMDSVVGSILTAHAITIKALLVQHQAGDRDVPVVPFINFPMEDLPLRGDIAHVLGQHRITAGDCFVSAVEGEGLDLLKRCSWLVLFDHNKLAGPQATLAGELQERVIAVLDHHKDEGLNREASPRIVETAGSCVSLLVRHVVPSHPEFLSLDPTVAALCACPIILDTANFDPQMKKTTEADLLAMQTVLSRDGDDPVEATVEGLIGKCRSLFDGLNFHKTNVSHLTVAQSLRRDYKRFTMGGYEVAVASWVENMQPVVDRFGFESLSVQLQEHIQGGKTAPLDALIVMFAAGEGDAFKREALWLVDAKNTELSAHLTNFFSPVASGGRAGWTLDGKLDEGFIATPDSALVASKLNETGVGLFGATAQHNVAVSRKLLVPALEAFLRR